VAVSDPEPTTDTATIGGPASSEVARRWLTVPLAAYVASTLLTWLTADLSGERYWSLAARRRWDSEHYLSIASAGYEMFRCQDRYPDFPDVWCGNTAWFPGYPAAAGMASWTGLSVEISAVLVTELCLIGVFVLLWHLLGARLTATTALAMTLAVVFPGAIYFHAIFPITMGALGLLLCVLGVKREWWWLAGVGAYVAFSTHLIGAVAPIMLLFSVGFAWRSSPWPIRVGKGLAAAALGASAYLILAVPQYRATGRWDAYWEHQRDAYGQGGFTDPLRQVEVFFQTPFSSWYPGEAEDTWLVRHATEAHSTQLVINLVLAAMILAVVLWRALHRDLEAWEIAAVLLAAGVFAMPFLAGAETSWYRNHGLVVAAVPVLRKAPFWLLLPIVLRCAEQYLFLGAMWYSGTLV
jgi:hypothetical protein